MGVKVEQAANQEPLDDLIIDAEDTPGPSRASFQIKQTLTISPAVTNTDFREIIKNSLKTRAKPDFRVGADKYGFVAGSVSDHGLKPLRQISTGQKAARLARHSPPVSKAKRPTNA